MNKPFTFLHSVTALLLLGSTLLFPAALAGESKPSDQPTSPAAKKWWTPPAPYAPMELLNKREAPKGPWTFVAFGDPHVNRETFDKNPAKWNQIVARVEEQKPELVLLLGDLDGKNNGEFEALFKAGADTFRKIPWFFAIGNHDFPQKDPAFAPFWDRIFKGPDCTPQRAYYTVDRGNVRFLHVSCLKCGDYDAGMSKGAEEWLAGQFASFKGDHLVLFNHFAPYTPTKYRYATRMRELEKSLYAKYQGKFSITFLSGHVHQYYRTRRGGATYFTICAGYSGNHGHEKMVPEAQRELIPGDVFLGDEGIGVFTVDGKTLRFEYKGLKDGKPLDSCVIKAEESGGE